MRTTAAPVLTNPQVFYLLLVDTFPTEVFLLPGPLIDEAGKDAVWCILLGTAGACLTALVTSRVLSRLDPGPFDRAVLRRGGAWGRLILVAFALAVLLPLDNIWGGYGQFVRAAILVHTPVWAVVLPALLVVVYAVPLDLGGVGRLAQLAVPWGILLIVVLFLLAAPWYAMDNLMPLLPTANVAWGSYQVFSFLSEVVFALYLASLSSRRAEAARALVGAPLVNGLLVLLLTAMPILLFGPTPAAMMNAPGMSAIRAIHYGFVVERLDTFVQPVWVIFVILKLLLWTMLGARLLAAALGIRWWAQIGRVATVVAAVLSLELYHLVAVERSVGTLWYRLGAPLLLVVLVACAILFRPRRSLAPA